MQLSREWKKEAAPGTPSLIHGELALFIIMATIQAAHTLAECRTNFASSITLAAMMERAMQSGLLVEYSDEAR